MKTKFFIVTTIPVSLNFFKGNLSFLSDYYEVTAISSDQTRLSEIADREGIRYKMIPMRRNISLWSDFVCLFKLIFFFLKEKPQIVHGNTPKASMLSMLAAWITRVPVRVYMCHGLRYQGSSGVLKKLLMFMERISCFCATEVLCVSQGVKDVLIKDSISRSVKTKVIGYGSASGIDLNHFSTDAVQIEKVERIKETFGLSPNDFVFIFVGRIVADKGINELLRAFNKLCKIYPSIQLLLVGPEERELNPISVESLQIIQSNKNVHAVGSQKDIRPFLLAANAFVFPSYREGFGMVLIEALAMGVPCISSNIIGCNEIILDNANGKLIPAKNEDALYTQMKWFVEHKDEDVRKMSKNSRSSIENRYEQKYVWHELLKEYQKLQNK